MENIQKEVEEMFDLLTREEIIQLLRESGFEVDDNGTGEIIFTNNYR